MIFLKAKPIGLKAMTNKKTKALFKQKLENIHSNLMQRHTDSSYYSSPIIGAEREAVKKELLSFILPPGYRIGSGTIVDAYGAETGQIDAVIEQPFSLSFPIATDTNRLYLADTVGAAFEIKSNLNIQGAEALEKIREIKSLWRHKKKKEEIVLYDKLLIPAYIIAYTGPKKLTTIAKKYINVRDSNYPNGVLIIDNELFYGRGAGGDWFEVKGKADSMMAFLACVVQSLQFTAQQKIDLLKYSKLL